MAKNVTSGDIFGGMFQEYEERSVGREEADIPRTQETVRIKREKLHEFVGHPFRVLEDAAMQELAESIRQFGIQEPLLVRPHKELEGEYEIISGHRRNHAAGLAGLQEVPVNIRKLDDETAVVLMVDANNKRETLLPSEKAWAYRMKADAIRRQGKRSDLMPERIPEAGMDSVGKKNGDSARTVQRYIRLTYLEKELLGLVDEGKIDIGAAYVVSFFNSKDQHVLLEYYEKYHKFPDKSQLEKLAEHVKDAPLSEQLILGTLPQPKEKQENVILRGTRLRKYFPEGTTGTEMETIIISLLEAYAQEKKSRNL